MKYLLIQLLLLTGFTAFSQNLWNEVNEENIPLKTNKEREIIPLSYKSYMLDYKHLVKELSRASGENDKDPKRVILDLPMPDGQLKKYAFLESPCFSELLSEKYPAIKSFRGYALDESGSIARVDYGHMGFHAAIMRQGETIYIDPYFKEADNYYIVYNVDEHIPDAHEAATSCGLTAAELSELDEKNSSRTVIQKSAGVPVIKNIYRMALACTGDWGRIYGTVENVMSRMNTGVNRLNLIFENEIAVKFELIDNNDELVFLDPLTDPYVDANMGREILGQNTTIINNIVGFSSYDIGHVFTVRCVDGIAGVAQSGSVCQGNKGAGVSCVGTSNVANFMVQTTAHEIGHQFSGGHTWNNCPNAQDQYSPGTAWEPGSGSTILSYAGACGAENNVVGSNDDYFHVGSLGQFIGFINTLNCGEQVETGNHTPDITLNYEDGFYIPILTPFELEGTATDEDGDMLTYNWEQMNIGPNSTLGQPLGNAPSFRSFPPDEFNYRIFPRLFTILSGNSNDTEVLPTASREFDFRFTVRDNHPGAGYTVWEDVSFRATGNAGPFVIVYPDQVLFKEVGDTLSIQWDVANTDQAPVNCDAVDIYLSTDNGQNFDVLLKGNTPNDGEETIIIPNRISNNAKIKVKARNNIFFNIARPDLFIQEPEEPSFFIDVNENSFDLCLPDIIEVDIQGTSFQGFDNEINLTLKGDVPPEAEFDFSINPMRADSMSTLTIDLSEVEFSGIYDIMIEATAEGADTVRQIISLNITGTSFASFEPLSPESGVRGLGGTPTFSWVGSPNATEYFLEVATNPAFGESNIIEIDEIEDLSVTPQVSLQNSTVYYWRVAASNECTPRIFGPIRTFSTIALSCQDFMSEDLPKNISATGLPTVTSKIEIFAEAGISDVNIKNIKGVHQRVGDLKATLVSPQGTEVILFENRCFSSNFNVGFDDDSPIAFNCSLNSGITMKPEKGQLSSLDGENIKGDWILKIEDTVPGEGGQFQAFSLELCTNTSLSNPVLVNNDTLKLPTGDSARILQDNLLSSDADNTAAELIYTLVELPEIGRLTLGGLDIVVGGQFTQQDLNDGRVRYIHEGALDTTDHFIFTVVDGAGGWIDMTRFNIQTDEDFPSSVSETASDIAHFSLYPNPVNDLLFIEDRGENPVKCNYEIFSLSGQKAASGAFFGKGAIDVKNLTEGMWLLRIHKKDSISVHRFSVIK